MGSVSMEDEEGYVTENQVWGFAGMMGASSWQLVGAGIASVLAYVNLPARILLPTVPATEAYLAGARLQKLPGLVKVETRELWKENGAVVMAVRRPG